MGQVDLMPKPVQVRATPLFDLSDIVPGRHVITITSGPAQDVVVLSLAAPPDYRRNTAHGGFPKLRADSPNRYRISHWDGGQWSSFDLPETTENYHAVQPFEPGWLLVRSRAVGEKDGNARLYDLAGTPTGAFHAGDGIESVQADGAGRIWVGYFDEGVFGDTPLGRAGLVCLDRAGRVSVRFDDLATGGAVPYIADCYALNVCPNGEVWLCYYTDFPLVRLMGGRLADVYRKKVVGSHAFAVSATRVLFAGDYNRRDRLLLAGLSGGQVREIVPTDERGDALQNFAAFGRGGRLYLWAGARVYSVDVDDLNV
jgi:hypothetical protein